MLTIVNEGNAQVVEKKSKFIAKAIPVQSEKEAISRISEIKKIHYNASHNVFAYRIGQRSEITRCSDDGEPSGTAGLPTLEALRGGDIKYALIVVTRYFGGSLLGTGGLARCYGKAASEAVIDAGVVEKVLCRAAQVEIPYNVLGKVQYCAAQNGYIIRDSEYADAVRLTFHIEDTSLDGFMKNIGDITNGFAAPILGEPVYIVKPAEKLR